MKYRAISVLLAFFMSISFAAFADGGSEASAAERDMLYEKAAAFLETLVGADLLPFGESERPVTRGGFVDAVEKLMRINASAYGEQLFDDVPLSHQYANAIYTALQLKWIGGGLQFRPGDAVLYSEGVKIMVSALGYDLMAAANGGYPAGYLKCASDLGLTKGISASGAALSVRDTAVLFFNALHANLYRQSTYGDINRYEESGATLLEEVYQLKRFEGLVTATPYNSLIAQTSGLADGCIAVNGVKYRYDGVSPNMLGRAYDFYMDTDEHASAAVRIAVEKTGHAAEVNLYEASMKNPSVLYYGGETAALASPYTLLYNGRKKSDVIGNYTGKASCRAVLLDGDGDGCYETVSVFEYRYMKVGSVDYHGETIGDLNGEFLDLSDETCSYFIDGEEQESLAGVKKGEVYAVLASEDGLLVQLRRCETVIEGIAVGKNADHTIVMDDGTAYSVSEYFATYYSGKLQLNQNASFVVGMNKELVTVSGEESEYKYGYLLGVQPSGGLDQDVLMKVYSETGEMLLLHVAKRPYVDGIRLKQSFYDYIHTAGGAQFNTPQLIRFAVRDGVFTKIDFSEVSDASNPVDYNRTENSDDSMTEYIFDRYVYRSSSTSFAPYFSVELTTVFYIPEDLDDERFAVRNNSVFVNTMSYPAMRVYDIDKTGNASVVTLPVGKNEALTYQNAACYVVEKVLRRLDDNGNEVSVLQLWRNGALLEFQCPDQISIVKPSGKTVSKGDLVSVYSYDGVTVTGLQVDFDAETGALNTASDLAHNEDTMASKISYNTGFLYNAGSSYLMLEKTEHFSGIPDFTQPQIRTFTLNYNALRNVYIYERETDRVTAADPSSLRTYLSYGADRADYAVLRHHLGLVQTVCIYR